MEGTKSITELAALFKCSTAELQVSCNFCKRNLKAVEKVQFEKYNLSLRWTKGKPFGCCRQCLRLSGQIEFRHYFQRNLLADDIRASTGASVRFQQIRCRGCLKPLTTQEKRRLEKNREFFYLVRGRLRSLCTFCKLSYNACR